MNQYFRFIFKHFGAPPPSKIVILQCRERWANGHILDDFRFSFSDIPVSISPVVDETDADLLVLPFRDEFLRELPGTIALYRKLRRRRSRVWIMLYGLKYRRIELVPANRLYRYYRKRQFLFSLKRWLWRFRLLGFVRFAIRIWVLRFK